MEGASANAYNQYRQIAVTTARPEKLLLMLYDGLTNFLKQAQEANQLQDHLTTHAFLMKSQAIIIELQRTLRMEYEISISLYRLYDYLYRRLVTANAHQDEAAPILEESLGIVSRLRDAWYAAAAKLQAVDADAGPA
jgi:flagellar protein FliS